MEEQQQQLHIRVLDGIARLENPHRRNDRHELLVVGGFDQAPVDGRSLQHLVFS